MGKSKLIKILDGLGFTNVKSTQTTEESRVDIASTLSTNKKEVVELSVPLNKYGFPETDITSEQEEDVEGEDEGEEGITETSPVHSQGEEERYESRIGRC